MDEHKVITLELENGTLVDCGVLAIFALNGLQYIALAPLNEDGTPSSADVMIHGYMPSDDGEDYDIYRIEDRETYNAAARAFELVVQNVV